MTTENEWVKLPNPAPKMLPKGTRARSIGCTSEYVALEDAPRGAFEQFVGPWKGRHWTHKGIGFLIEVWLPPGYRFEGSEVVKDEAKRSYCHKRHGGYTQLCDENCLDDDLGDTPEHLKPLLGDARRIAPGTLVSEETRHGVVWKVVWNPESTWPGWGSLTTLGNWNPNGGSFARYDHLKRAIQEGRCYPTADARRIGREEFGMVFDGEPERVSPTPPPQAPAEKARACACGATSNLRDVVIERQERHGRPTLTVYETRCAACEVKRRRAELLVQAKREVKRADTTAPSAWPEGAGDDYEL
jgi:hypothetical protein